MSARRVVVGGYYGFGNLGDEAIRMALRQELAERGIDAIWLTACPQARYEIDRKSVFTVYAALRRSHALVLGGGGLLQNRTSNRSLLYYLGLIALARLTRRPVFLIGQGIGPIRGRFWRWLARIFLKHAAYIGCRDRESAGLLHDMGLNPVIDADLFCLLPEVAVPEARSSAERHIVLSLKGGKNDGEVAERAVHMLDAVSQETKISVTLLPFFPAEDLPLSKEIAERASVPCRIVRADAIDNTMQVLENADLVVSSRLHGLEFALRAGVPMIAIREDPKINAFVSELEESSELHIRCARFPSSKQVVEALNLPPSPDAMRTAYRTMHVRAMEGFSRFVDALEGL